MRKLKRPQGVSGFRALPCRECGVRLWVRDMPDGSTKLMHEEPQCEAFRELAASEPHAVVLHGTLDSDGNLVEVEETAVTGRGGQA